MKKKNLLTVIVSLALVVVLGVGATLAALSATDDKVVNTFKFADGIAVTLQEPVPTEKIADEEYARNTEKGVDYSNIVPGQKLNKAPEVAVETDVPAYVFIKVSGFDAAKLTCGAIADGWTAYTGTTNGTGNGIYYRTATADTDFGAIFTQVQTAAGLTETDSLPNVTIQVYAIQQNGVALADAYTAAVASFG